MPHLCGNRGTSPASQTFQFSAGQVPPLNTERIFNSAIAASLSPNLSAEVFHRITTVTSPGCRRLHRTTGNASRLYSEIFCATSAHRREHAQPGCRFDHMFSGKVWIGENQTAQSDTPVNCHDSPSTTYNSKSCSASQPFRANARVRRQPLSHVQRHKFSGHQPPAVSSSYANTRRLQAVPHPPCD